MRRYRDAVIAMWFVVLATAALVGALGVASAGAQTFLTPAQVNLLRLLPGPPGAASVQTKDEMTEIELLERTRSPQRAALATADAEETVFAMFGALLGPGFKAEAMPVAAKFFDRLGDTEEDLVTPAKSGFGRLRPYLANPGLHPVAPMSKSGAYPSGHATRGAIMGIVLADMVPERRAEIFARMDEYTESRVVAGVHYRSDIVAGRSAGIAIDAVLFNDAGFVAAYGPARADVRKALGLAP